MSYTSILVHVDHSSHAHARMTAAAQLAVDQNAHLAGVAMNGIAGYIYQDVAMDPTGMILSSLMDAADEAAKGATKVFDSIVGNVGVSSYETRLVNEDPASGLALQARYADLVVISQSDRDDPVSSAISDLPEYVMLNSGRPVLLLPRVGKFERIGGQVLVAWDGSVEATHALTGALPLLQKAQAVTVVVINPASQSYDHGEQPGADIGLYLARHGVKVEVRVENTSLDIGNALLSLVADLNVDLLVMGGYGHTRFRELLLGGATRSILDAMTVPVLMAH